MQGYFTEARAALKDTIFESRVDPAFFNQSILSGFDEHRAEYSASALFERFTALKAMVEIRKCWKKLIPQGPILKFLGNLTAGITGFGSSSPAKEPSTNEKVPPSFFH
jgi:hypothetical protein